MEYKARLTRYPSEPRGRLATSGARNTAAAQARETPAAIPRIFRARSPLSAFQRERDAGSIDVTGVPHCCKADAGRNRIPR
jgi:hypothetical protein